MGSTPSLTRKRPAKGELLAKLSFADDLCAALFEKGKGFVRLHVEYAETGALFVFVQQFSHLLDREWRVLGAQRLLALALAEEGPIAGERGRGQRGVAFRCDTSAVNSGRKRNGAGFRYLRPR